MLSSAVSLTQMLTVADDEVSIGGNDEPSFGEDGDASAGEVNGVPSGEGVDDMLVLNGGAHRDVRREEKMEREGAMARELLTQRLRMTLTSERQELQTNKEAGKAGAPRTNSIVKKKL